MGQGGGVSRKPWKRDVREPVQHDVVTLATPRRSIWCLKDSLHLFVRLEAEDV